MDIIENYKKAVKGVIDAFVKKYFTYEDGSKAEYYFIDYSTIDIADMIFNAQDMITAIELHVSFNMLYDWYHHNIENESVNLTYFVINYIRKHCTCLKCIKARDLENKIIFQSAMQSCLVCGNKRCPKATDHANACTNSNDVGQAGSSY